MRDGADPPATFKQTSISAAPINFAVHQARCGLAGAREDFEQMLALLVQATQPTARLIAANPGDWGIDVLVGTLDGADVTVFQAKYLYPVVGAKHQQQIHDSFNAAVNAATAHDHRLARWTLCVPGSMDGPTAASWDRWKNRMEMSHDVSISLWDETSLRRELLKPQATHVREHFYGQRISVPLRNETKELTRATACRPQGIDSGPGLPIKDCDPLDLEVHPAEDEPTRDGAALLPGYVRRAHDIELGKVVDLALSGTSAMSMLVGESSTGKTRACWEAVQPLAAHEWRVWHPVEPTHASALLAGLRAVQPRTVVWLNEAQHYLDAGEQVAAALHALLTDPGRAPILVLATLWTKHHNSYLNLPGMGASDLHPRVRELLAGRSIVVPTEFDEVALADAKQLAAAGDRLLARVLARHHDGHIAQHLAGGPELLLRYRTASAEGKAMLRVAADARRLGAGPHFPLGLLADGISDYLRREAYDPLDDEKWLDQVLAELTKPVHGNLAPLQRVRERPRYGPPGTTPTSTTSAATPRYKIADYLEQRISIELDFSCPPISFWHAIYSWLTDCDELRRLADAARARFRLQWADALYRKAAKADNAEGHTGTIRLHERDGVTPAELQFQRDAAAGAASAPFLLAAMREGAGDTDDSEALAQQAVDAGATAVPGIFAVLREGLGNADKAQALIDQAAAAGDEHALIILAVMREGAGDTTGAQELAHRAPGQGAAYALALLAEHRDLAGDHHAADALAHAATAAGHPFAQMMLEAARTAAHSTGSAESAAARRAASDRPDSLTDRMKMRKWAGDKAHFLCDLAATGGASRALVFFVVMREWAEDAGEATRVARRAVDSGDPAALILLTAMRARAGDHAAECLLRYGLDPDGAPTPPWG